MDKTKLICQTVETVAVCATIAIIGGCLVSRIPALKSPVQSEDRQVIVSNAVLKVNGELILK